MKYEIRIWKDKDRPLAILYLEFNSANDAEAGAQEWLQRLQGDSYSIKENELLKP
jgi:hypothetical protein